MKDNEVWFTKGPFSTTGAQIDGGDFVVTDYYVTPGESTSIQIGYDTKFATKDGSGFHFGADRSGSADTAAWWNSHISASSTTFNHEADKLNFAIKGTLTLHVSGHFFKDGFDLVYQNVYLAQGHSGLDNNWWLGVTGAIVASGQPNTINVQDQSGGYGLQFQRGGPGNSDNTIWVFI